MLLVRSDDGVLRVVTVVVVQHHLDVARSVDALAATSHFIYRIVADLGGGVRWILYPHTIIR